jgi:ankyrin repeat protein
VDLNATNYDKRTALMIAAEKNHYTTLLYLLVEGARPDQQDRWGGTALSEALRVSETNQPV